MSLIERTKNACDQLMRYSYVFSSELLDVVEIITDINDDLHHGRSIDGIIEQIEQAKTSLDILGASITKR